MCLINLNSDYNFLIYKYILLDYALIVYFFFIKNNYKTIKYKLELIEHEN